MKEIVNIMETCRDIQQKYISETVTECGKDCPYARFCDEYWKSEPYTWNIGGDMIADKISC